MKNFNFWHIRFEFIMAQSHRNVSQAVSYIDLAFKRVARIKESKWESLGQQRTKAEKEIPSGVS